MNFVARLSVIFLLSIKIVIEVRNPYPLVCLALAGHTQEAK
jgi:hypothetical protein